MINCKCVTFHLMPEVEGFGGGYQSFPDLSNFIPEMFHQHLQQCFSTQCMMALLLNWLINVSDCMIPV